MYVNKIGSYHRENGTNNQDSGFEFNYFNCVVDGCSEGKHSEVGAKLFSKKLLETLLLKAKHAEINEFDSYYADQDRTGLLTEIFEHVLDFLTIPMINRKRYVENIHNYMLFTILMLEESWNEWVLNICGDGFVITQDNFDNIEFHDIDHCSTPMYLSYIYLNAENLELSEIELKFLRNQSFKTFRYDKELYMSVGIASDGLAYVIGTEYEDEFKDLLLKRKDVLIKRFINKINYRARRLGGSGFFKDDITISMR